MHVSVCVIVRATARVGHGVYEAAYLYCIADGGGAPPRAAAAAAAAEANCCAARHANACAPFGCKQNGFAKIAHTRELRARSFERAANTPIRRTRRTLKGPSKISPRIASFIYCVPCAVLTLIRRPTRIPSANHLPALHYIYDRQTQHTARSAPFVLIYSASSGGVFVPGGSIHSGQN